MHGPERTYVGSKYARILLRSALALLSLLSGLDAPSFSLLTNGHSTRASGSSSHSYFVPHGGNGLAPIGTATHLNIMESRGLDPRFDWVIPTRWDIVPNRATHGYYYQLIQLFCVVSYGSFANGLQFDLAKRHAYIPCKQLLGILLIV